MLLQAMHHKIGKADLTMLPSTTGVSSHSSPNLVPLAHRYTTCAMPCFSLP